MSDSHTLDTELFALTVWFCLVRIVTVPWLFLLGAKLFNLVFILQKSSVKRLGDFLNCIFSGDFGWFKRLSF